jgi:acetolactate synthase-1/2/3 large subunit
MKIRVADYIANKIAEYTDHIFLVTGGGAMHLNDAFGRQENLKYICCHNEQACSIAAEAYTRVSGKIGAINVTTGPGGINALNGVFGAWVDSIPMIIISGQVKRVTCLSHYNLNGILRQLGDQEVDIVAMTKSITKFSVLVDDPLKIKFYMEKALSIALEGRPGPVWLDIPVDVQSSYVDVESLAPYNHSEKIDADSKNEIKHLIKESLLKLVNSQRPVVYAGSAIWHSKSHKEFIEFIEKINIPVVTAWNSNDLLWDEHNLYAGRPGSVGNRGGNFTVQNSDCLIVLGSRLNIRLVSYNWENFAKNAFKIGVDIDNAELNKPTSSYDIKLNIDLKDFFNIANDILNENLIRFNNKNWNYKTKEWLLRYPVCLPEYWNTITSVNPYCFIDSLFEKLDSNDIVVCADGTACVTAFQGAKIKKGQRLFHNSGCASMGYDLPAAIGAYFGRIKNTTDRIICIAGDGSIMMNLQELETISGNNLNIKIFLLNNKGYHSIRQTQQSFFKDNIVGCGLESGLTFPDFEKIANAFNFVYKPIRNHNELDKCIEFVLKENGPTFCEVFIDMNQQFSPKLSSRKLEDGTMVTATLEDMSPFLDRDEFNSNML